jgi:hypothetical protein
MRNQITAITEARAPMSLEEGYDELAAAALSKFDWLDSEGEHRYAMLDAATKGDGVRLERTKATRDGISW